MFAAIHFRLCLSLVPVMLSIPFAWKVHETKMLKAIHDKTADTKYLFEELEALGEALDNSFTVHDGMRSTTSESEIMDLEVDEGTIRADKIIHDVSILNEEVSDMNHFLGINFGMEKRFSYMEPNSVLKHHDWVCMKWKEMQEIMHLIVVEINDFARTHLDIRCLLLHSFGILVLYLFRPVIWSCCIYGLRLVLFPFKKWMLQSLGSYLKNKARKSSKKDRSKQKPSASFEIPCTVLARSLSNIKDPESISPSTASFGDVCDQAAMFDEKKNSKGLVKRKDVDSSEWLESSFIEGGIQTYSMVENESVRSTNKTDDYLQFSTMKNTERDETDTTERSTIKILPKSSTPRRLTRLTDIPRTQKHDMDISSIYTPQKLRNYMYNKCEQKKGLELALGLSKLTYSQCIVVNEQKKLKNRDQNSLKLDYFVNSTKDKIRRRLMNMSYV